jgi:hypothetical protein
VGYSFFSNDGYRRAAVTDAGEGFTGVTGREWCVYFVNTILVSGAEDREGNVEGYFMPKLWPAYSNTLL